MWNDKIHVRNSKQLDDIKNQAGPVESELEFSYHEGKTKEEYEDKSIFEEKKIRTYFTKLKNTWVGQYIGFNFVSDKCYLLKSYRDKHKTIQA